MVPLSFPGYNSMTLPSDDPILRKWTNVRSKGMQVSIPFINFKGQSVDELQGYNAAINMRFACDPTPDQWLTPSDAMSRLNLDCISFAILKYAMLLNAGFPEDQLRVVVGRISSLFPGNHDHAWCAACTQNEWWVLDSLFNKLVKPEEYINWVPIAAVHSDTGDMYAKSFTINDVIG